MLCSRLLLPFLHRFVISRLTDFCSDSLIALISRESIFTPLLSLQYYDSELS